MRTTRTVKIKATSWDIAADLLVARVKFSDHAPITVDYDFTL